MKKAATIIITAAALLSSACEKTFQIHPEYYSDMLRLECVADAGKDSVYIFPSLCVPTHIKMKETPKFNITSLSIEVNGQERKARLVTYHEEVDPTIIDWDENGMPVHGEPTVVERHRWTVPGSVPEGASLKIKASAEGTEDVYAETAVPVKPKVSVISAPFEYVEIDGNDAWITEYIKLNIHIEDKENETGFYAIQFIQESHNLREYTEEAKEDGFEDYDHLNTYSITPEDMSESSFDEMEDNDGITIGYDGYRLGVFWDGEMRLYTADELENSTHYVRVTPDLTVKDDPYIIRGENVHRFRVRVIRVSPEVYRYSKAYNLQMNNGLAEMGLAPVNFTYTNVTGGCGYFGAMVSAESEWISNPFHKEEAENRYRIFQE